MQPMLHAVHALRRRAAGAPSGQKSAHSQWFKPCMMLPMQGRRDLWQLVNMRSLFTVECGLQLILQDSAFLCILGSCVSMDGKLAAATRAWLQPHSRICLGN